MADVIKNDEGQLMLLTVFMILIGIVGYTAILNSMIFSANLQSTGLEESKQEIRDFRLITEAEIIKAAYYSNTTVSDPNNQTQVLNYFYNHMTSYNQTIKKIYSARGASVEVIVNNISLNRSMTNMTVNKYHIEWTNNTFANGSLVIPMDDNQTTDRSQLMKVYGLIYKIVDSTGPSGELNNTSIPVWTILQNPVNSSVLNFSRFMYTTNNASTGLNVSYREYSGGPFLINASNLDSVKRGLILNESKNKSIKVHELMEPFYYDKAVKMVLPPKIAVYPNPPGSEMMGYYIDGQVPYTSLDNTEIQNGNLSNYDILMIPHENMAGKPENVITSIVGWVANGGILHVNCGGTDTMDKAVETYAGSGKPWYGFIGINKSNIDNDSLTYIKLIDSSTPFNVSYSFNTSPPVSLAGLADPGARFSPLAQSSNKSGILGNANGSTKAFSLHRNGSQVNPGTNILGIAAYSNGMPVYEDFDSPADGIKDPQFIYVEAPYDNGLVVYLAGHDQADRSGFAERFIFESFFAASMRQQAVTSITSKNINVTIKYFDGKVRYTDTFIINT